MNAPVPLPSPPLHHKNCPPPLWAAMQPQMMILKDPLPSCSSKSHKYGKETYIVLSYHYCHKVKF